MASVTQFAQYLMKLDPQKSQARLTFYHFLKYFCDRDETLSLLTFDRFYRMILSQNHWQDHSEELGIQIEKDLTAFHQNFEIGFELNEVLHSHQIQVVPLKRFDDLEDLIHKQLRLTSSPGDKNKLIKLSETHALAISLFSSGQLRARVFPSTTVILHGNLELLSATTDLHYTPQLDLQRGVTQVLEGQLQVVSRFVVTDQGCQGEMLRGPSLQKHEALNGVNIAQVPELYHALKRLERHYIQPESDPFYQDLIALLEKSYQLVSSGHKEVNRKMIESTLQKGKSALRNIFPNDKLLLLLVTNIEYLLIQGDQKSPMRAASRGRIEEEWTKNKDLS